MAGVDGHAAEPPESIHLPAVRATLSRVRESDAAAMAVTVRQSLSHLAPWMPWADDSAATATGQLDFVRAAEASWETGDEYVYLLRTEPDGPVLGASGLHRRIGPGALEIGYWLHTDATGRGLAGAATVALVGTGLALPGIERVEVHVDVANVRSAAVTRAAGLRLDRTEHRDPQAPAQIGRVEVWVRSTTG